MKRAVFLTILVVVFGYLISVPVRAEYVLPYPSYMPGNKLYRLSLIFDRLENFWYWGNIAQTKYHLKLADKYLVEAKTLFEYNQYLLGAAALNRSDKEFSLVPSSLKKAASEGKDVSKLAKIISEAAAKHMLVLTQLRLKLPETYAWTPEKQPAQMLDLNRIFTESISLRHAALSDK